MQMMGMPGSIYQYTGTWNALVTITTKEGTSRAACIRALTPWCLGIRGLFKGMIPNYLKVVPSISVSFVTYEWAKTILDTTI